MNATEVQELFIAAAEIDRRLPIQVRPSPVKSMSLPYVYDWADVNGWGVDRIDEEEQEYRDRISSRVNPADVTLWEQANELIRLVPDESQRRCLLSWAISKAGKRSFSKWCRDEGIHQETGRRRKDRAVNAIISATSCVEDGSTHDFTFESLLPTEAEIGDKRVIINGIQSYAEPGSRPLICDFDAGLKEYAWAERQNELRRQREAKRRKAEAA